MRGCGSPRTLDGGAVVVRALVDGGAVVVCALVDGRPVVASSRC